MSGIKLLRPTNGWSNHEDEQHPQLRSWLRRHGGDVQLVHLPDIGIKGNTHFPFSDLNNVQIADLLSRFPADKNLD